jgi:hypothetical protein
MRLMIVYIPCCLALIFAIWPLETWRYVLAMAGAVGMSLAMLMDYTQISKGGKR